jgi:hypothetical protein
VLTGDIVQTGESGIFSAFKNHHQSVSIGNN